MAEGIEVRTAKDGTRSYRASVWSNRENKRIRSTFPTLAAAKAWRADAQREVRHGRLRAAVAPTLDATVEAWQAGAKTGTIRTRGRRTFAPSTIVAVEQNYRLRVRDRFGEDRLDRITLQDVQELVDELDAQGMNPSTIESTILPLRLAYRYARGKGVVTGDPTDGLELPEKARGQRLPPSPRDAAALLAAAPEAERPLWATAMLAGLRRGELMALRWQDVDLKAGRLSVERSYDPASGEFRRPKSRQGVRKVPIGGPLAVHLREHMIRSGRRDGLVFGATATRPFTGRSFQDRADAAWAAAGLTRVTLHACRHLYASMSIAAGVNAHALCTYMGHSGIQVTYDLYGHLFPGNEAEASALLDAYLTREFASV